MSDELINAGWGMRSAGAMSENISSIIRINLSGTGYFCRVNRAGAKTDLTLPDVPVIEPKIGGLTIGPCIKEGIFSNLILRSFRHEIFSDDFFNRAWEDWVEQPANTSTTSSY